MTKSAVPTMVMVCVWLMVLPHPSSALHVYVTEPVPPHPVRSPSLVAVTVAVPWQASVAVSVAWAGTAWSHSMVMSSGRSSTHIGSVVSVNVMVWVHCAVLPQASVAVHVRVIVSTQVPLSLTSS